MASKKAYQFKKKTVDEGVCDHKVNSKHSTLMFIEGMMTMAYPQKKYAVCRECGTSFEFMVGPKGKLIEVKDEEETPTEEAEA